MKTKITEKQLIPYKKTATAIIDNANKIIIKKEEDIKLATDILSNIGALQTRIKGEKAKLVEPAKRIIQWAKDMFGPIEEQCNQAESIIKGKMLEYDSIQTKKNEKKMETIANQVADGTIEIGKASEKMQSLQNKKSYEGETGKIQFKNIKRIVITDISKLPRKYLMPNEVLIRTDALAGTIIPGVEIRTEKIVAKGRI